LLAYPFLSGVVTSTEGSCPLQGEKIKVIGQGIMLSMTSSDLIVPKVPPLRWYHIGRIDQSKRIEILINAVLSARQSGYDVTLDLFGIPSGLKSELYYQRLVELSKLPNFSGWLSFRGPIRREEIFHVSQDFDGFLHAFNGSLDKALLESVLCGRFVASTNREFLREFGGTFVSENFSKLSLSQQLLELIQCDEANLRESSSNQQRLLKKNHSFENWISKLLDIMKQ
jgi:glycosyltransferase involved in cell wall biosynthesis